MPPTKRLGVGIVGAGFVTGFHLQAFVGVRDADVVGIWSRTRTRAEDAAARARQLGVGDTRVFDSIATMVADPAIDAIWICAPNYTRVETVEEIVHAMGRGDGRLVGVACEKPLGRTVAEAARVLALVKEAGLQHAYLENQVFAPQIERGRTIIWARGARATGRPYLARAAEEHSGPHAPWFWQGTLQGGGVLNDMMCHSALLVRHLLTAPGASHDTLRPVRVSAHIKSLKWSRPDYATRLTKTMGPEVDYTRHPAEDYASMMIEFETTDGQRVVGEATTSWSFVGAGLRLSAELLGPEYSMAWNTLDTGLELFFSRDVKAPVGEDLIEKQQAELGLMPVVADEAVAYGYEAEDRHVVQAFLRGESPRYTFEDGLEVVKLLMAGYMSAEQGRTLDYPPSGLDTFVPQVATGDWKPV
jgi:predicted dehydrogenase